MSAPASVRPGYGPLWWILGGSALLSVVIVGWQIMQSRQRAAAYHGDGKDPATYGFELDGIESGALRASGLARDALIVLDDPATVTAIENDALPDHKRIVVSGDRVIGVVGPGGEARAYPLRLMTWHPVVNDRLGGRPIVVIYDPLCDAVVAFDRRAVKGEREFGYSGLVLDCHFLMYDRAGRSLWSPLGARAVSGPDAGRSLTPIFLELVTWGDWRHRHPESTVLAPLRSHKKRYKRSTYGLYRGHEELPFPVEGFPPPEPRSPWDRVIVLEFGGGQRRVLALAEVAEKAGEDHVLEVVESDRSVRLIHDPESGSVRVVPDGAEIGFVIPSGSLVMPLTPERDTPQFDPDGGRNHATRDVPPPR